MIRRGVVVAIAVSLLSACSQEPPEYESKYVTPASSSRPAAKPALLADPRGSFIDEFDRPDSALWIGDGWDLRGVMDSRQHTPPPAEDGFLRNSAFTYAGDRSVYAARQFAGRVRAIGAWGRFTKTRHGAESALLLMLTPNDRIVVNVVHFAANRRTWNLAVRGLDGQLKYEAKREIIPPLELDRSYVFELEVRGRFVDVRVANTFETVEAPRAAGLVGDRGVWGQFKKGKAPAGELFHFETVWARVDGERTAPVPHPDGHS